MGHIYDVIIIGGGAGGYSAALYCARAGLDTLVFERASGGGQMSEAAQIENYPGYDSGIDGFELGMRMKAGAERFGACTINAEVTKAELTKDIKAVNIADGTYSSRTVIIATGAEHRKLQLPNETHLVGNGVSYCAVCDGMFFKNKTTAVIGGGDTAATAALLLSRICKKVFLIHRKDALSAAKIYHESIFGTENIEFYKSFNVTELVGKDKLDGIKIKSSNQDKELSLSCDGVFICIGRTPMTELFFDEVMLDRNGYVCADETTRTNLTGVFAVGDVRSKTVRQVITAASDGAVSAHYVQQYLSDKSR